MRNLILAAACAALATASPATAQSAQDRLDARYDRAGGRLQGADAVQRDCECGSKRRGANAGKCARVGIDGHSGSARWDFRQESRPYEIVRRPTGQIAHVAVKWTDDMPARVAVYRGPEKGCYAIPVGGSEDLSDQSRAGPTIKDEDKAESLSVTLLSNSGEKDARSSPPPSPLDLVFDDALSGKYGDGSRTTVALMKRGGDAAGLTGAGIYKGEFKNTPQRTWSVAKSIAATLVGAAVHRGEADVNASAGLGVDENDPRRAITIDNALRMTTGRYSDTPGNRTDPLYWGGATVDEVAQTTPLIAAPGIDLSLCQQ